jgi:hypothetical protein
MRRRALAVGNLPASHGSLARPLLQFSCTCKMRLSQNIATRVENEHVIQGSSGTSGPVSRTSVCLGMQRASARVQNTTISAYYG